MNVSEAAAFIDLRQYFCFLPSHKHVRVSPSRAVIQLWLSRKVWSGSQSSPLLNPHQTQVERPGEEGALANQSYITRAHTCKLPEALGISVTGDQCGNMHILMWHKWRSGD